MTAEEMKQQWPLDEWTAPKKTLLLYNMFSPRDVEKKAETKFLDGIKDHFREQCTKYGKVVQITVDPRAIEGRLYVLFDCPSERQAAEVGLQNSWFGNKQIFAKAVDDSMWKDLSLSRAWHVPDLSPGRPAAERKMLNESTHSNPCFHTTVLERRFLAKRITESEFKKFHHLRQLATVRPNTQDDFELGQYVLLPYKTGSKWKSAGAMVTAYDKAAKGGPYTVSPLGRHSGRDVVGCRSDSMTACSDSHAWQKMIDKDPELARDMVFIEFNVDLENSLQSPKFRLVSALTIL